MAKLANYGDLPSGFARFFTFGEDKDRLELSVYRQLRQLLVREALACHAAEKRQPAIGIRAFGTSGIEDL